MESDVVVMPYTNPATGKGWMDQGNLAVCPEALKPVDPNAETLWPVFLKRVGLHFNSRKEVIENDGHRAAIVRQFGISSLVRRLALRKTERDRARVWWRESIACSEGDSEIPDTSLGNMYVMNRFIVTPKLKYPDPRVAWRLAPRAASSLEKRAAQAIAMRKKSATAKNVLVN